jgi:hypothetical protein
MLAGRARACFMVLSLSSGACAALGYDFGDYQAADGSAGAHEESSVLPVVDSVQGGDCGASLVTPLASAAAGQAADTPTGGATGSVDDAVASTLAAGGAPHASPPESCGEAGEAADGARAAAGAPSEPQASACLDAQAQCGSITDACGRNIDCGPCFWWFEQCHHNLCVVLLSPSE